MLKFTIRDVLWLTLVVAALLTWWGERERSNMEREKSNQVSVALESSQKDLQEIKQFVGGDELFKEFLATAKSSNSAPPRPDPIEIPVTSTSRRPKGRPTNRPVPDPAITR